MKNLLILGAGGMGKEIYYTARHSKGYGTEFIVKGFLDFPNPNWNTELYPPIIGFEDEYQIQPDDVFACSIGDVVLRRKICEKMKARGAHFQTLIHNDAELRENVTIGEGSIIDGHAIIGSDAKIGENCLVQNYAGVAHDCVVGNYCRIDVRVLLVGGVVVGNNVTIHTGSMISHKVTIGYNAVVGAMSFVIRKVKPGIKVQGNPAKQVVF